MILRRRSFISGLAGILAASQMPMIITRRPLPTEYAMESGVLMPIRKVWQPPQWVFEYPRQLVSGDVLIPTYTIHSIPNTPDQEMSANFSCTRACTAIGFNIDHDNKMELVTNVGTYSTWGTEKTDKFGHAMDLVRLKRDMA